MPTSRGLSTAVDIPGLGVLVVGGCKKTVPLKSAELLRKRGADGGIWRTFNRMIKARWSASAVYCDGSVFVAGGDGDVATVEVLSLPSGQPGQWTLVDTHPSPSPRINSMCVFKERIVAAGELKHLNTFV